MCIRVYNCINMCIIDDAYKNLKKKIRNILRLYIYFNVLYLLTIVICVCKLIFLFLTFFFTLVSKTLTLALKLTLTSFTKKYKILKYLVIILLFPATLFNYNL